MSSSALIWENKMRLNQDFLTNCKIIQLFTAAASILIGFFVNLFDFDSSLFFYVCTLISGLYVLIVLIHGRLKFFTKNRALIFLMAVMLLSILVNLQYSDVYSLIRWMEMFNLLFATMLYTGEEDLAKLKRYIRIIFRSITCLTFLMSAGSLICAVAGPALAAQGVTHVFANDIESVVKWNADLRKLILGGLYQNSNQLGINAFCSGMLSLYFLNDHETGVSKGFDMVNLAVQAAGLAAAGCRSVYVGTAAVFAMLMLPKGGKKTKWIVFAVLVLMAAGLGAVTLTKMEYIRSGEGIVLLLDKLTGNRYRIWRDAVQLFLKKPLLGFGLGNIYQAANLAIGKGSIIRYHKYTNAHNILLNILAMSGITGLFSFSLIGRDCFHGLKKVSRTLAVFCAGLVVVDLFDIFLIFTDKLPSLLFPMIAGYGLQCSLREPKPFYFFSNLVEEDIYKELYTKAERPGQQAQKFNRLIAEGFALNGRTIECDTSVLASDAIVDYRFKNLKNHGMYHYSLSINVPGIKTIWNILGAFFHTLYARYGACVIDVLSIDNAVGALAASKLRGMPDTGIVTDLPEHFSGDGLYAKIVYRIMSWCGSYVFLTKYMDEKLNPKHKPYIVMEGLCDINVERETVTERNKSIIFAGEIDEQNGVMTFVRAFNQWGDHGYDLYYYGTGEAMDMLKKESEGNDRIHIMGLLLNRELLKVMNRATMLVNPRPIHQDFVKYSFPSKVMEYMNTGTYHASSHLACIPDEYFEYIGDMGDGSTEDILKFLKEFEHMTPEYLNEQGRRAQEFVLKYKNNAVQAARIAELLDGMYE